MLKRVHFRLKSLVLGFSIVICSSCGNEAIDMFDCTGETPTYTIEVKPILDASCAKSGCHNVQTHENGYDFSSYNATKQAIQSGRFLGAIQHKNGFEEMPNDGPKLSDDKIRLLTCWVQNETPE